METTISERVFEEFCTIKGIPCVRIPVAEAPTPDYELQCGRQLVIVEVKEIAPNREERISDRLLRERGYGSGLSNTPGARLRKKIDGCWPQIKARTEGKFPGLLVVFDCGRVARHIDPYNMRVAMYGLELVYIAVPSIGRGSPYATHMDYGPKRKMTPEDNTSISAIGALFMRGRNEPALHVYHNRFARVPLDPSLLGQYGIEQFELDDETIGTTSKWRRIALTAAILK